MSNGIFKLNVDIDQKQIAEIEAALSGIKNGAPRAMSRAINRTIKFGKTQASKLIRKEYTIKKPTVQNAIREYKSTPQVLHGRLGFKDRPKQLRNFAIKKTKKRVFANVKRSTGYKKLTRRAFLQTINNGPAILRRLGESRYPVDVLHGPSVPQLAGSVNVGSQIQKDLEKKLAERIDHETNAILKGYAK